MRKGQDGMNTSKTNSKNHSGCNNSTTIDPSFQIPVLILLIEFNLLNKFCLKTSLLHPHKIITLKNSHNYAFIVLHMVEGNIH